MKSSIKNTISLLLLCSLLLASVSAFGVGAASDNGQANVNHLVILLDSSTSMRNKVNGVALRESIPTALINNLASVYYQFGSGAALNVTLILFNDKICIFDAADISTESGYNAFVGYVNSAMDDKSALKAEDGSAFTVFSGNSYIDSALISARNVLSSETDNKRAILLYSDGLVYKGSGTLNAEGEQKSLEAAAECNADGIRVFACGVGDKAEFDETPGSGRTYTVREYLGGLSCGNQTQVNTEGKQYSGTSDGKYYSYSVALSDDGKYSVKSSALDGTPEDVGCLLAECNEGISGFFCGILSFFGLVVDSSIYEVGDEVLKIPLTVDMDEGYLKIVNVVVSCSGYDVGYKDGGSVSIIDVLKPDKTSASAAEVTQNPVSSDNSRKKAASLRLENPDNGQWTISVSNTTGHKVLVCISSVMSYSIGLKVEAGYGKTLSYGDLISVKAGFSSAEDDGMVKDNEVTQLVKEYEVYFKSFKYSIDGKNFQSIEELVGKSLTYDSGSFRYKIDNPQISEDGILPNGEYVIELGVYKINGSERIARRITSSVISFTVSSPVVTVTDSVNVCAGYPASVSVSLKNDRGEAFTLPEDMYIAYTEYKDGSLTGKTGTVAPEEFTDGVKTLTFSDYAKGAAYTYEIEIRLPGLGVSNSFEKKFIAAVNVTGPVPVMTLTTAKNIYYNTQPEFSVGFYADSEKQQKLDDISGINGSCSLTLYKVGEGGGEDERVTALGPISAADIISGGNSYAYTYTGKLNAGSYYLLISLNDAESKTFFTVLPYTVRGDNDAMTAEKILHGGSADAGFELDSCFGITNQEGSAVDGIEPSTYIASYSVVSVSPSGQFEAAINGRTLNISSKTALTGNIGVQYTAVDGSVGIMTFNVTFENPDYTAFYIIGGIALFIMIAAAVVVILLNIKVSFGQNFRVALSIDGAPADATVLLRGIRRNTKKFSLGSVMDHFATSPSLPIEVTSKYMEFMQNAARDGADAVYLSKISFEMKLFGRVVATDKNVTVKGKPKVLRLRLKGKKGSVAKFSLPGSGTVAITLKLR